MSRATGEPRVGWLLRGVSLFQLGVLGTSGLGLFLLPAVLRPAWPWEIPPFNAAFVGAIYLASVPAIALLALPGGWSPARVILPMLLAFTGVGLLVTLAYLGRFQFDRWATWVWCLIFTVLPLNAALHLCRYRRWPPAGAAPTPGPLRWLLRGLAALFTLYALAMLLAPEAASVFWPWPVDSFHGRLYSGAFLAGAVGAWSVSSAASPVERAVYGLNMTLFGGLAVIGLVLVDLTVRRVNWTAPGTWLWVGAFGVLTVLGAFTLWPVRRAPPQGAPHQA